MLFHNQVIILCKFLQLRLRHLELWEWIRLWCHPITHLVKGQPNQDGPQDFCEITWKNKLLHIMFQILVMNESGILKPGFGFWKSYMQGEMGWRLIELGWTFLMVFAKFWVDYLWKLSNLMKKSVIKLALNFFGAYSGVLEDPILDIRWITNIVLKVLCGFEYLLNFSMRVNNEAQRTLIIVYYNIMYYKCSHTFH